ncbi:MAG: glycoside hydrolase family 38 C-terminal domain-containing protein, partial [Armatimonadia bacterium]
MSTIRHRHYTCGFHSDVIWLEDQRDYAVVLMGCMGQNLQACRADDGYGVFLHELTYLKPYLDSHPLDRPLFFDLLKAGRIGTGGAHSLPSENLISGEAFIRNFAYGRAYHEYLGDRPEIAMLWDVFGHCSQLPQMLAGMRFTGLIWSKDIRGAHPLFWHQGLDGTKLLTRRVMYGHVDRPRETVEQHLDEYLPELESLGHDVDLRVHCNDFTPPAGWIVGRSGELAQKAELPWLISGQAHRHYFREIHKQARRKQFPIPTSARDFEYHHMGTGLAHIDLKILNRRCENELIEAEKWSSFATMQGLPYPHYSLDKAWRQVFFGQHHDAITGPCCDRAYLDLMDGYREALQLARAAGQRAREWLAEQVRQSKTQGIPLVVFNSLNWQRRDIVEQVVTFDPPVEGFVVQDRRGDEIPFEARSVELERGLVTRAMVRFIAEAPSLGHATYRVVPVSKALPKLKSGKRTQIENEHYRIKVDPTHGGIVSLWDKRLERELLTGDGPGNELVALAEDFATHPEPPWELNTSGGKVFSRDFAAKVRLEQGPVSSTLTITGKFKDCRRVQRITLYQGLPRIEFETELQHYDGREDLIAVTFPAALPGATPVFDDRFGCVTKRRSRGKLDYRTWQWRNYSDCGARRAHQWVDLSHSARLVVISGRRAVAAHALGPMSLVLTA